MTSAAVTKPMNRFCDHALDVTILGGDFAIVAHQGYSVSSTLVALHVELVSNHGDNDIAYVRFHLFVHNYYIAVLNLWFHAYARNANCHDRAVCRVARVQVYIVSEHFLT